MAGLSEISIRIRPVMIRFRRFLSGFRHVCVQSTQSTLKPEKVTRNMRDNEQRELKYIELKAGWNPADEPPLCTPFPRPRYSDNCRAQAWKAGTAARQRPADGKGWISILSFCKRSLAHKGSTCEVFWTRLLKERGNNIKSKDMKPYTTQMGWLYNHGCQKRLYSCEFLPDIMLRVYPNALKESTYRFTILMHILTHSQFCKEVRIAASLSYRGNATASA